jgi:glucokinase
MMISQNVSNPLSLKGQSALNTMPSHFAGFRLVADSGGTNTRYNVLDDETDKLLFETVKLPTPLKGPDFLKQIAAVLEEFKTKLLTLQPTKKGPSESIYTASIAVAGPVDMNTGEVIGTNTKAYTLPIPKKSKQPTPFAIGVENTIKLRTKLVNDADAFVLGEVLSKKGALYGKDNAIGITLGTGIGGGAVYNGGLFTINGRSVMEVGHVVIEKSGRTVNAPRTQGCWEAYASGTGLLESGKAALKKHPTTGYDTASLTNAQLFEAAGRKEPWAMQVITEWHKDIAAGLANVINTMGIMDVVIGGGLCQRVNYEQLIQLVKPRLIFPDVVKDTLNIVPSKLEDDAALIGAGYAESALHGY